MPRFDPAQLDTLVASLESAEAGLTAKTAADGDAKAAAARAAGDLAAAQATNRAAVKSIKDYVGSLTDEGDTPDAPPAAEPGPLTLPGDVGTGAGDTAAPAAG